MRFQNMTAIGLSNPVILNPRINPFNVAVAVLLSNSGEVVASGTATGGTWEVQYSHNGGFGSAANSAPSLWRWLPHPFMSGVGGAGNGDGNIAFPCSAVRLNVLTLPTGGTAPGFMFVVRQAGQAGGGGI